MNNIKNTNNMQLIDLRVFKKDLIKLATIADVVYNEGIVNDILDVYGNYFSESPVSIRTTTKPNIQRGINARYVSLGAPHDPYTMGVENNLIHKSNHPIDELLTDIQSKFPVIGHGIDMGVNTGLEKIWAFFPHIPQSIDLLFSIENFPESIKTHKEYFKKNGLHNFSLFGIDYKNKTINIYFMVERPWVYSPDKVSGMISELGFTVPSTEVLEHCSMSIPVYFTFSWDSLKMERVCFATIYPNQRMVPTHLDPLIKAFTEQAPSMDSKAGYIYNPNFRSKGNYYKIEVDYTNSMIDLLKGS